MVLVLFPWHLEGLGHRYRRWCMMMPMLVPMSVSSVLKGTIEQATVVRECRDIAVIEEFLGASGGVSVGAGEKTKFGVGTSDAIGCGGGSASTGAGGAVGGGIGWDIVGAGAGDPCGVGGIVGGSTGNKTIDCGGTTGGSVGGGDGNLGGWDGLPTGFCEGCGGET
ncbi:glycine-rich cell wall structural protein-like [Olea europaea var. sylvestris]|uniref:glycine-rich cell wall structural protein-like n=1 Tax=Olea europaea var. sylvestris TaxID=158386 RepID=UPI000C1D8A50|nr:glycine-rich cell wall structural protein-like [Olea europaea var. sylvestris]